MRIRRTKNLLYIVSSVMVLGLALLSFDAPAKPTGSTSGTPAPTQAPGHTATPSPAPTQAPGHTATPSPTSTPTPTPTPTNTPTPTPTPSLAQLNAAIAIRPATDETGTGVTTVITNYLNDYYSNDDLHVEEIDNITCYYKEGLAEADYFAYVSYDITYEGSNVPIPAYEEYIICVDGDNVTVLTESQTPEVTEALFLSRASQSVSEFYIKELVRCYMNAKLAVDEELLSSLVTDPTFLNMDSIRKNTEYIEEYKNFQYLIYKCPEEIPEFDYLVFLAHDAKIVNISTLAASLEEFMITMDDQNYPQVFHGVTSKDTDTYRMNIRMQEEYQTFLDTKVTQPLIEAVMKDPNLAEFMERISNATGSTE